MVGEAGGDDIPGINPFLQLLKFRFNPWTHWAFFWPLPRYILRQSIPENSWTCKPFCWGCPYEKKIKNLVLPFSKHFAISFQKPPNCIFRVFMYPMTPETLTYNLAATAALFEPVLTQVSKLLPQNKQNENFYIWCDQNRVKRVCGDHFWWNFF